MASSKEYLDFVLEQLSDADGITYRAMMGEYLIYCRGKVIGGVYDNRFLVKPSKTAVSMLPYARRELPYPGTKEMLLVDNLEDKVMLKELADAICAELPAPKAKKATK